MTERLAEPRITMTGGHFYQKTLKITVQDGSVTIDFTGLAVMPIAEYERARIALDALAALSQNGGA